MSRQQQRERDRDETDRSSRRRLSVSDRTSWSGLAKRAYNVAAADTDAGESLQLAGLTLVGAFVAGALPLPFTWLAGIALAAAVGGWTDTGSTITAAGIGTLVGFVFGLTFAPALFGLGIVFTLGLALAGGVAGGVGHRLGA